MTLRVILQIVPHGDESKTYEIGRLDIFNKGRIEGGLCEYGAINLSPQQAGLYEDTVVHFRKDGAWGLVHTVIEALEIKGP